MEHCCWEIQCVGHCWEIQCVGHGFRVIIVCTLTRDNRGVLMGGLIEEAVIGA